MVEIQVVDEQPGQERNECDREERQINRVSKESSRHISSITPPAGGVMRTFDSGRVRPGGSNLLTTTDAKART